MRLAGNTAGAADSIFPPKAHKKSFLCQDNTHHISYFSSKFLSLLLNFVSNVVVGKKSGAYDMSVQDEVLALKS
jgi:hypothetical protein